MNFFKIFRLEETKKRERKIKRIKERKKERDFVRITI
jgi:hypothetical protein